MSSRRMQALCILTFNCKSSTSPERPTARRRQYTDAFYDNSILHLYTCAPDFKEPFQRPYQHLRVPVWQHPSLHTCNSACNYASFRLSILSVPPSAFSVHCRPSISNSLRYVTFLMTFQRSLPILFLVTCVAPPAFLFLTHSAMSRWYILEFPNPDAFLFIFILRIGTTRPDVPAFLFCQTLLYQHANCCVYVIEDLGSNTLTGCRVRPGVLVLSCSVNYCLDPI